MRKIVSIIVLLALLITSYGLCEENASEVTNPYSAEQLSSLSIDELLELRECVSEVLSQKGYVLYHDLSHGDKGDEVTSLQERLKELGFYNGNINGKYDGTTEKAVKAFQKANSLDASGIATQQTQVLLFSGEGVEKVTPTPKPTAKPTPTLDPKYAEYQPFDYTENARYPERHRGDKVRIDGTVVQVVGTRWSGFSIRLQVSGSSDVVYVDLGRDLEYNILDNDRVTIYATMNGLKTYTTILNSSVTIPQATADYVILK